MSIHKDVDDVLCDLLDEKQIIRRNSFKDRIKNLALYIYRKNPRIIKILKKIQIDKIYYKIVRE